MKSRIWIDFSSPEAANQNWEQLVRLLHGQPAFKKPALGKAPSYLSQRVDSSISVVSGKLASLRQALTTNSITASGHRRDFLAACLKQADELRIRVDPNLGADDLGAKALADSEKLRHIRNQIADWVLLESDIKPDAEFRNSLLLFLENLRELKSRPKELNSWKDAWFSAHSVFVYETFLYIVAALIKNSSFEGLHDIFTSHYLKPESDRYSKDKFEDFTAFWGQADILQKVLAPENLRLFSPAAELIHRQADRTDLPFNSLLEADLLAFLMALISADSFWKPSTSHYASHSEFPLFIRATQHRSFLNLALITGIPAADDIRERAKAGYERLNVGRWHDFWSGYGSLWDSLNLDNLDKLK